MRRTVERYRAAVAFAQEPPPDCKVVVVAPREPLATKGTTQGLHALARDYELGRDAGLRAIARWRRDVEAPQAPPPLGAAEL